MKTNKQTHTCIRTKLDQESGKHLLCHTNQALWWVLRRVCICITLQQHDKMKKKRNAFCSVLACEYWRQLATNSIYSFFVRRSRSWGWFADPGSEQKTEQGTVE